MTQRTADVINKPGNIKRDDSPERIIKNKVADIDRAIEDAMQIDLVPELPPSGGYENIADQRPVS